MEKREDDIALIKKIKKRNCEKSLKTLIHKHSALCFDVYKKYTPPMINSGVCVDFSFKEKDFLIYKSALSFKSNKKTKFSTWLSNQVRYFCLNSMNKNDLIPTEEEIINHHINKENYTRESGNKKIRENIEYIFNILDQIKDKRIERVFCQRYFSNPNKKSPWSCIAKELGVSTQTAINLHDKGLKILRKKMNSKEEFIIDII